MAEITVSTDGPIAGKVTTLTIARPATLNAAARGLTCSAVA